MARQGAERLVRVAPRNVFEQRTSGITHLDERVDDAGANSHVRLARGRRSQCARRTGPAQSTQAVRGRATYREG
jgi:hypothetical protein